MGQRRQSGVSAIPRYPVEWVRFVRGPAAYVERARALDNPEAYEPWAAFVFGLAISLAFAVYEAHRSHDALHKETEQVYLFLVAVVNFLLVHGACRVMRGKGSLSDMAVAFEYLYGFLVPAMFALMTLMMGFSTLFPGLSCRLALDTFECSFPPTRTSIIAVSAIQAVFIAGAIYALVVFNFAIARLHQLPKARVVAAQAVGLGALWLISNWLFAAAHWVATRFDTFIKLGGD